MGYQAKTALHMVEPGGIGGHARHVELRPLRQPGLHLCVLVGAVVVDDQVQIELLGDLLFDPSQEAE